MTEAIQTAGFLEQQGSISFALWTIRQEADLSQNELAKAIGVSNQLVSSWETGRRTDSLKLWQLLAVLRVCGLSLAEFETKLKGNVRSVGDAA